MLVLKRGVLLKIRSVTGVLAAPVAAIPATVFMMVHKYNIKKETDADHRKRVSNHRLNSVAK